MRKFIFTSLAFLLLFPCLLCAKSIAVSETQAPNDLLSSPERLYLTDVLRDEAIRALPPEQGWNVMSRENAVASNSADFVVQTQISKFGSSLVVSAELYEFPSNRLVASYTGKGATVEDIERTIKEQAPDFFKKILDAPESNVQQPIITADGAAAPPLPGTTSETPVATVSTEMNIAQVPDSSSAMVNDTTMQKPDSIAAIDTTQTKPDTVAASDSTQAKPDTVAAADTTQTKPDSVATADTTQTKPTQKEEKSVEQKPAQDKPKRFWGGITVGVTYNDYFSTKFGLNDIKPKKDYNLTISGAEDLLKNFWGVGFKGGMSCMFVASPYFNLRSDLSVALRQGKGKTNTSVILSWKDSDKADEKSDLEIEYSAMQLNIDLPFLARVSIPNAIYFEAGPMFSFNVYSKSESKITDIYGTEKFEEKGELKAFEFDLAAGIGIARSIGKSMLDFDLRFVFGMTRISDANDAPKTWQGQLNITYWFL